jgi:hypothetical protein
LAQENSFATAYLYSLLTLLVYGAAMMICTTPKEEEEEECNKYDLTTTPYF